MRIQKEFSDPRAQYERCFHQRSRVGARRRVCCVPAGHLPFPGSHLLRCAIGLEVAPRSGERGRTQL